MQREIRIDLKDVSGLISRLLAFGDEFRSNDQSWSHYKNQEDWSRCIPSIPDHIKRSKIERIYCDGRDMGHYMSSTLLSINSDFLNYPTLSSIVNGFTGSCIDSDLNLIILDAEEAYRELGINCWAFERMIALFRDQEVLAKSVKHTLNLLKDSDLYKMENGIPMNKYTHQFSIGNIIGSNVSVSSNNVTQAVSADINVFTDLIEKIQSSEIENKEELIASVDEMQRSHGSQTFAESYKKFIAAAATHMEIISPFLVTLSALL